MQSELSAWRTMFADSCDVCVSGFTTTRSIHLAGQRIAGGEWEDWSVSVQEERPGQAVVLVTGAVQAATVRDGSDEVVERYDSLDNASVVYTVKQQPNDSWLIVSGDLL